MYIFIEMDTDLCLMLNSACMNLIGHEFKMDFEDKDL